MPPSFTVVTSRPDMASRLEEIQRASFPNLAEAELMTAAHYLEQIKTFPEGQHAIIDHTGLPVGSSTDFIVDFNLDNIQHKYMDITGHNYLTHHDPKGDWLYGADIGIHPDYRSQGLGKLLYAARHNLVRRLNLKGHIICGMLKGYQAYKKKISAEDYVAKVIAEEIFDPVVSVQLKRGFIFHGIVNDYVEDPSCDNKAALQIWPNKDYKE